MLAEKKMLSLEEIEAQTALELPDRELPLVTIILTNVLTGIDVTITVSDIDLALQLCAQLVAVDSPLQCKQIIE